MSVQYELTGEVALITLDRPDKYNSVSTDLSQGLVEALTRAGSQARAAVVTGRGKAFCSGADLADLIDEYQREGPDLYRVIEERFNPMARALAAANLPTIAAINGPAAGAGLGLALGCDLRVMAADAYLLSAFIGVGLVPDTGTTWLLAQSLGVSRAVEFTATNRRMPAEEARELGLVHRIVDAAEVVPTALAWAAELAGGPTPVYQANRRIIQQAAAATFDRALDAERDLQAELGRSPLHLEGMTAFREKRAPDFRGVAGNTV
jgi:2-(1,2-epoxy-1,2-dihydrophenyl)acetyl-CoA isomerase